MEAEKNAKRAHRMAHIKQSHLKHVVELILSSGIALFVAVLFDDVATLKDLVQLKGLEITKAVLPGYEDHYNYQVGFEFGTELELLAAELDSIEVLTWFRDSALPRLEKGPGTKNMMFVLLEQAFVNGRAANTMRYLIQDPRNAAEIQDVFRENEFRNHFPDLEKLTALDIDFLRLVKPVLLSCDDYPFRWFQFHGRYPAPLSYKEPLRTIFADELQLLQPTLSDYPAYFDCLFTVDALQTFGPRTVPRHFLYILDRPSLSDGDRATIIRQYQTMIDRQFKDPYFLEHLHGRGLYYPTPSLLPGLLDMSLPAGFISNRDPFVDLFSLKAHYRRIGSPIYRRNLYYCLLFALKRFATFATPRQLAEVIEMVKQDWYHRSGSFKVRSLEELENDKELKEEWHSQGQNHGLVRLFLYYGVDYTDQHVRKAVKPSAAINIDYSTALREDLAQVRCWKRWGERKLLGGLPMEICEVIMFKSWEYFCGPSRV